MTTSEEIGKILGPLPEVHSNDCNCHEGAFEREEAYASPSCKRLTAYARQERQRQINALVLLVADHRSRALRQAADGVSGNVDFMTTLGKKGWKIHNKLTSTVARYLQDVADEQLLIKSCRWCRSTQHTSRAHDDAQF